MARHGLSCGGCLYRAAPSSRHSGSRPEAPRGKPMMAQHFNGLNSEHAVGATTVERRRGVVSGNLREPSPQFFQRNRNGGSGYVAGVKLQPTAARREQSPGPPASRQRVGLSTRSSSFVVGEGRGPAQPGSPQGEVRRGPEEPPTGRQTAGRRACSGRTAAIAPRVDQGAPSGSTRRCWLAFGTLRLASRAKALQRSARPALSGRGSRAASGG